MEVGDICQRTVLCCEKEATAQDAAKLMRHNHVGDLVVTATQADGVRIPLGMITDRDLVLEVLAQEVDPMGVCVGELIGPVLGTATEDEGVYEVLSRMWEFGVRRMPVINLQGGLVGIITVDDVIAHLSEQLTAVNRITSVQQHQENMARR